MPLKPNADRVLILPDKPKETTAGGIIIPENSKDPPLTGIVFSVGPQSRVSAGQKVVFSRYAGTEVEYDGDKYLVMAESELLAMIED